jgi:hypothetical protein
MSRLLLVLAMLVAVAVGFAGTLYLLPTGPAAESRYGGTPARGTTTSRRPLESLGTFPEHPNPLA